MKVNQTSHYKYQLHTKRNEEQKLIRHRKQQNGNREPFPLAVTVVT